MTAVQDTGSSRSRHGLVAAFLGVAALSSLALVMSELGALDAPGCGASHACDLAAKSRFGRVPGLNWPLSSLGFVWFVGLLAGWLRAHGDVSVTWRRLALSGGVASIFLLGVLSALGLACPYCLATHGANLAFLVVLTWDRAPSPTADARAFTTTLLVFAFVGAAVAGVHAIASRQAASRTEQRLESSLTEMRSTGHEAERAAFTGRHARLADARVRLVVFTDFQCEDCHDLESRVAAFVARQQDVSLAVRHFPMCKACNPHAADLHPNACWAARAAEAAAIVGGDEGYWRMHAWLFERHGAFTNTELDAGLAALGFDRARFVAAMNSPETATRVADDVALGMKVGLTSTPMIFVNGVELRGWRAPDALERAVATARSTNAAPAADRPPSARERFLDLWRTAPLAILPPDSAPHVLGPTDARVQVTLWGDYQEPTCAATDIELRDLTLQRGDVAYAFRPFPVNPACNPAAEKEMFKLACLAALGAEAASVLQGNDGFWALHDWLMTHRLELDDETMTRAAIELGMDRAAFWDALRTPELPLHLSEDAQAGKALGLNAIPMIYVNGRRVETWKVGETSLLPAILEEAAAGR